MYRLLQQGIALGRSTIVHEEGRCTEEKFTCKRKMYIREVYMKKEDVQKRMLQGKGRWEMNRKFEDVLKINVRKEEKKTGVKR